MNNEPPLLPAKPQKDATKKKQKKPKKADSEAGGPSNAIDKNKPKSKPLVKKKSPLSSSSSTAPPDQNKLNNKSKKNVREGLKSAVLPELMSIVPFNFSPMVKKSLAHGGATFHGMAKPSKNSKKRDIEVHKSQVLPQLMSIPVITASPNASNPKTSSKKSLLGLCPSFKGISAFSSIVKKNNIWEPPVETVVNSENFIVEEMTIADFTIDIERKPSKGRFIRKKSSCESLKIPKPKFPVKITSHQDPDVSMEKLCDEIDNIALNSTLENNDLNNSITPDTSYLSALDSSLDTTGCSMNKSNISSDNIKTPKKQKKPRRLPRSHNRSNKKKEVCYPEYINLEEVDEGLKNSSLVKGCIRINQRNFKEAYVTSMTKGDSDYIIKSVLDQNRALEGDEVILRVKPQSEWDGARKTASVVYISKMMHPRTTVGTLYPLPNNENFAVFKPRDMRFPHLNIPTMSWPPGFSTNPREFEKNLFLAKITEWTNLNYAKGLIIENIGVAGDLKIENLAILKSNGLDHQPFGNEMLKYLPKTTEVQDDWLVDREDLRKECIFTIDPLTARDLDDAVSCKTLPDGNLEIGVHIADVGFFLKEGTELDEQVAWKATTIYMVNNVYHMLPVELCMNCSLLPGKDKLSFSVFWIMTPEGEILSTRFAKTVMNSCVQLAYEHAQAIIDDPDNFDRSVIPKILNGYSIDDAKDVILKLYHISKNLRNKRFLNGALRINQVKLSYDVDPKTGYPVKYYVQEQKEANRLIEEFMLLANISVAEKILKHYPDVAFLRLHEPPKMNMLAELKRAMESVGIHVDITSSKTIQQSLLKYSSDDEAGRIRANVLNHLFAKAMTRARYFCPEVELAAESFTHYALNVPLYTHFTSPIRRYADVVVHRLLAASLGLADKPKLTSQEVGEVAARCNLIKYNAKKAQEESSYLYLCHYIEKNSPFIREAAVIEVRERSFDVIVLECGEVVRVHLHEVEGAKYEVEDITNIDLDSNERDKEIQKRYWRVTLSYPPTKQYPAVVTVIELFTVVRVLLRKLQKANKLEARLVRPNS